MSRRSEGAELFVGRLSKHTRNRDLEDVFEQYGRLARCDVKYGAEMAYAFVDFEDRRDAEDAIRHENGRDLNGASIIVEWAKGSPRRPLVGNQSQGYDECYKCHRVGHWARDCTEGGYGGGGGGGGYRGGGGGGGYRRGRSRSRSPRRRSRRSHSRSRSRDRRRSRSRSRDRKRDSRRSRTRSRSPDASRKDRSNSPSRSKSRSPEVRGRSRHESRSPSN